MHSEADREHTRKDLLKVLIVSVPAATAVMFGALLIAGFQQQFSYGFILLISFGFAVATVASSLLAFWLISWGSGFQDGKAKFAYESEEARRVVEWRAKQVKRFFYSLTPASIPLLISLRDQLREQYTYWPFLGASLALGALAWWAWGFYFRRQQEREERQERSGG